MKYSYVASPKDDSKLSVVLPKSETPTFPEMKAAEAKDIRARITDLAKLPENYEISSVICSVDRLEDPLLLKVHDAVHYEGVLVSAKYYSAENGVTYVYVAKGFDIPAYAAPNGKMPTLKHPKATALLRIDRDGNVTEMHRWPE